MNSGFRSTCFSKGHNWGECTCKTEVHEDEGFEFQGTNIIDPSVSECGRFFVEPSVYYGEAYINWLARRTNE